MKNEKFKILLIYGGPSNEFDVSVMTAKEIKSSLKSFKYTVDEVLIEKNLKWKFTDGKTLNTQPAIEFINDKYDIAFIAMHGKFGEDGELQALLDSICLPYLGSGSKASGIAMNKMLSNEVYEKAGLYVPEYIVVNGTKEDEIKKLRDFPLPFVIKPLRGGSSIGVSIIRNRSEIDGGLEFSLKEEDEILVQSCIDGRELTCGVIERDGKTIPLVPTEIVLTTSEFFDYKAKYTESGCNEVTPPENLALEIYKEIQNQAVMAHKALGCKTFSRSDFMLSQDDKLHILETNTIPGMTEFSLLPKGAKALGIEFSDLLDIFIAETLRERLHKKVIV